MPSKRIVVIGASSGGIEALRNLVAELPGDFAAPICVVLHVAPESAAGGPLAFVRDGDVIELDVPARRLELRVSDEELAARRRAWQPRATIYPRGYGALFARHVTQADKGCDFDFLEGQAPIPEPEIH